MPANAQSFDWMILDDTPTAQTIRVTVCRSSVGPTTPVAPGASVLTVAPNAATHNANSVGAAQPFVPGFYYGGGLETDDVVVLPSLHVRQDHANTVIPGTLISPGTFVRI